MKREMREEGALLLTCNLFSFNADVNWLHMPGSASPNGYSRLPVL